LSFSYKHQYMKATEILSEIKTALGIELSEETKNDVSVDFAVEKLSNGTEVKTVETHLPDNSFKVGTSWEIGFAVLSMAQAVNNMHKLIARNPCFIIYLAVKL